MTRHLRKLKRYQNTLTCDKAVGVRMPVLGKDRDLARRLKGNFFPLSLYSLCMILLLKSELLCVINIT